MFNFKEGQFPDHFKDVSNLPRVNITKQSAGYRQFGFDYPENDPLNPKRSWWQRITKQEFYPTPDEALEIYQQGKAERYSLSAGLISDVIDHAIDNRDQRGKYGLLEEDKSGGSKTKIVEWLGIEDKSGQINPFLHLNRAMQTTLVESWNEVIDSKWDIVEQATKNNFVDIDPNLENFVRLLEWRDFYNNFLLLNPDGNTYLGPDSGVSFVPVFSEVPAGTATGASIIARFLEVIPAVCERDVDPYLINPKFLTNAAKNSFGFIGKGAMMNFDMTEHLVAVLTGVPIRDSRFLYDRSNIEEGKFDPRFFKAIPKDRGVEVVLNDALAMPELKRLLSYHKGSGQIYTTGCPAIAKIDKEDTALKKLWDWNVEIAAGIYRDYWSCLEPAVVRGATFNQLKARFEEQGLRVAGIHY